jgi:hypothetical protein
MTLDRLKMALIQFTGLGMKKQGDGGNVGNPIEQEIGVGAVWVNQPGTKIKMKTFVFLQWFEKPQ